MAAWRMAMKVGSNGPSMWEKCRDAGVAAITYDEVGKIDFSGKETERYLSKLYPSQQASLRRVAYEIKKGDTIYVKDGGQIVGKGIVVGRYRYDHMGTLRDESGRAWRHQLNVKWDIGFPSVEASFGSEPLTVKALSNKDVELIERLATRKRRWWIYKCNSKQHPYQVSYGDWEKDFFEPDKVSEWGSTEWIHRNQLERLRPGDIILAHQTDRQTLVGIAEVIRLNSRRPYVDVILRPLAKIGVKINRLKEVDPRIAEIPALQAGPIRTIYAISEQDARLLLRASGVPHLVDWVAVDAQRTVSANQKMAPTLMVAVRFTAPALDSLKVILSWKKQQFCAVTKEYSREGWKVRSVEREKVGYDLHCSKGSRFVEVEVKGISGSKEEFLVTSGEVRRSETSRQFVICIVTGATSKPRIHKYRADEFLSKFALQPTQYRACKKPR